MNNEDIAKAAGFTAEDIAKANDAIKRKRAERAERETQASRAVVLYTLRRGYWEKHFNFHGFKGAETAAALADAALAEWEKRWGADVIPFGAVDRPVVLMGDDP